MFRTIIIIFISIIFCFNELRTEDNIDFEKINFSKANITFNIAESGSGILNSYLYLYNWSDSDLEKVELIIKSRESDSEWQGFYIADQKYYHNIEKKDGNRITICFNRDIGPGIWADSLGFRIYKDDKVIYEKYSVSLKTFSQNSIIDVTDLNLGERRINSENINGSIGLRNKGESTLKIYRINSKLYSRDPEKAKVFDYDFPVNQDLNQTIEVSNRWDLKYLSLDFNPMDTIQYIDTLEFISNSHPSFPEFDNISIVNGKGIPSDFEVIDYTWKNARINLPKYETYPFDLPSLNRTEIGALVLKNSTYHVDRIVIRHNVKGTAFKFKYDDDKMMSLGQSAIWTALFKDLYVKNGESYSFPVYFNPTTRGRHILRVRFETSSRYYENADVILKGFAYAPMISIKRTSYEFDKWYVKHKDTIKFNVEIKCENIEYGASTVINDITSIVPADISFDSNSFGDNGFMIDKSKFDFPITLNMGESLTIPVLYHNKKKGVFEADLIILSDAEGDSLVHMIVDNSITSLDSKTITFSIHPNPANDKITIAYEEGIKNIKIMDLNGKVIFKSKYNYIQNVIIDLSNISPGVYFIELNEDKELMQKIMIE